MNHNKIKNNKNADDTNLIEIFLLLKKHLISIISIACVSAVIVYFATLFFVAPTYRTSFRVYVNNRNTLEEQTTLSNADITASRSLASTYGEIISGRSVLMAAANKVGLNEDFSTLSNMVSVSHSSTSEIITVYVTAKNSEMALQFAKAIIDVAEAQIATIVDGSSMRVIDSPYKPDGRFGPSYSRNVLVGFLVGAVLMCVIVFLKDFLDDKINSEEQLEQTFGIPVIGTIPNYWSAMKAGDKYAYYGSKSKKEKRNG